MNNVVVFEKSVLDILDKKNHKFQCFLPHINFLFSDYVTKKIHNVSATVQMLLKSGEFNMKNEEAWPLLDDIEYLREFFEKISSEINGNFKQSAEFIFRFISDLIYKKNISESEYIFQEIY